MTDDANWVRIERTFDADIEQVWAMWADPAKFASWYGPNGARVPVAEMDVTVGGTRRICMEMAMPERTMRMWFSGVFKEVNAPERLVYTESMTDADGTLIPAEKMGLPPGHPAITEVIVELRAEGGKTHMTMVHVGVPAGTAGEGGWQQAFGKLDAMLAR